MHITKPDAELAQYQRKMEALTKDRILLVEDGSVDIDKLEEDGWYVIVYRQGSNPPTFLEERK